ncbi:MAG TPA: hypothetical protein VMF86_03340 [Stellaceae bacterium]|nr:hypothetical protein [Stellaceae bacterium]
MRSACDASRQPPEEALRIVDGGIMTAGMARNARCRVAKCARKRETSRARRSRRNSLAPEPQRWPQSSPQEFTIVPIGASRFAEATRYGVETFQALSLLPKAHGHAAAVRTPSP